jgi:hypothetical protein
VSEEKQDAFDRLALETLAKVKRMADELREYCDSVVIITTIAEGDSSQMIFNTRGNRYAIEGSVERFKRMERAVEEKRDQGQTE